MLKKLQKQLTRVNSIMTMKHVTKKYQRYQVVILSSYITIECNGEIAHTFETLEGAYRWLTFIKE